MAKKMRNLLGIWAYHSKKPETVMIVVHSWWPQVRLFKFILFFNELPSQLQSTVRDFWNEYQLTFDALVWTVTKANNTLEPHKPRRPECVCVSFFIIWKPQAEIPDAFMYNYEFDETKCDENFSPAPLELVKWTYWRLCQMKTLAIVKWHNFGLFNRTNENDAMTKTKPNQTVVALGNPQSKYGFRSQFSVCIEKLNAPNTESH